MADRYDSLTPPLLIAALRSMPRRYAEALELASPRTAESVFEHAATDMTVMLARLEVLDEAIHTTADHADDPLPALVDSAIIDSPVEAPALGAGDGSGPASAADALAAIEAVTDRLAGRLERLGAGDWNRAARSPGAAYSVTDLARGAVRVAAERLRAVEASIRTLGDR